MTHEAARNDVTPAFYAVNLRHVMIRVSRLKSPALIRQGPPGVARASPRRVVAVDDATLVLGESNPPTPDCV